MSQQLPDIKAMYLELNVEHFGGELPEDLPVIWNSRLRTTAGYCRYKRSIRRGEISLKQIDLNPRLIGDNPKAIKDTLIHEMVHAWLAHTTGVRHKHDIYFQKKMDEIVGYKRSHTYHNYDTTGLKEERKVEYHCPIHGVIGRRARMPRSYDLHRYTCRKEGYGGVCGHRVTFVDTRPPKKIRQKAKKSGGIHIKVKL